MAKTESPHTMNANDAAASTPVLGHAGSGWAFWMIQVIIPFF